MLTLPKDTLHFKKVLSRLSFPSRQPEWPKCHLASDTDLAKVSPGNSDSVGGIGEMQPGSDINRTTRAPRFNPGLIWRVVALETQKHMRSGRFSENYVGVASDRRIYLDLFIFIKFHYFCYFEKDSHIPAHDSRTGWLWQQCWEDTGPPEHQSSLCNRFCKTQEIGWYENTQVVSHFVTFWIRITNSILKAWRKWRFLIMAINLAPGNDKVRLNHFQVWR